MNSARHGFPLLERLWSVKWSREILRIDKYAIVAIENGRVVGHLMKSKSGKFAKTVFFT